MIDRSRLWEFVKRLPASQAAELLAAVGLEVPDLVGLTPIPDAGGGELDCIPDTNSRELDCIP